ncbi:hypothetical protein ACLMAJ_20485 [Nocardia sp. KC 131]|uniref:hypothetical protein n=1 Tax=Nocardia arseniciresistens TaxID=3392119 RepID=UPI00398F73CD
MNYFRARGILRREYGLTRGQPDALPKAGQSAALGNADQRYKVIDAAPGTVRTGTYRAAEQSWLPNNLIPFDVQ